MTARIRLRRDTAANWTSADPTLAAGEIGLEIDTGLIKVGDGATAWTALAYLYDERIGDIETDVTSLLADVAALEANPVTRSIEDIIDNTSTTGQYRILSQRTAVAFTTKVLSADVIYGVVYEPTPEELTGDAALAALKFKVTSGGDHVHIGAWQLQTGYPLTLLEDSGSLAASGTVTWAPSFTPEAGKLYVVGLLCNASTTVTALSANGAAGLGTDSGFANAFTHFTGANAFGSLADFPTPALTTGTLPLICATYS